MNLRRIIAYLLPVIIIMLFLVIMLSPLLFKGNNVTQQIEFLASDISNEDWHSANKNYTILVQEWQKTIKRIQFGENRDDINELTRNIIRLKGLIIAEDKNNALSELFEAEYRWDTIGT
jgi:predicted PurR-regulated permease PerM